MRGLIFAVTLALAAGEAPAAETAADACALNAAKGEITYCERAVSANPADLVSQSNLAAALFARGDYDRALDTYLFVAQHAPNDSLAHYNYGLALAMLHRYRPAQAELQRAVDLDPKSVNAHRVLAIAFTLDRQLQEAHRELLAAANLGNELEMFQLALNYAAGVGTPPDSAQSLHWLLEAANHGHIGAMDRLAEVYERGDLDQPADAAAAAMWKAKAREARASLGIPVAGK
ncbi:MAG TPA: tetratricopeptide repeat protein [Candidatus Cybelea sp.]|nr:tetratricopeptide repeat protein [Candidatus Cybelea sp.]